MRSVEEEEATDDVVEELTQRAGRALSALRGAEAALLRPAEIHRQVLRLRSRIELSLQALAPGYHIARKRQEIEAQQAAARAAQQEALAATLVHCGCAELPPQWMMLGWRVKDGRPVSLPRGGGHVFCVCGSIGSGKSQAMLTVIEGAINPRPGLASESAPPTACVAFHCDPSGVSLPELLWATLPNRQEADVQRLQEHLGVTPKGLQRVILVVPAELVREYEDLVRKELGAIPANLEIRALLLHPAQLSMRGLEALLGADPDHAPAYIEELLRIAQRLGDNLSVAALRQGLACIKDLPDNLIQRAERQLSLLEDVEDQGSDLWDLVEPGALTVFALSGRWLRRRAGLGLVVALMNAVAQRSPRHGEFQRIYFLDEVNRLRSDPSVWEQLVTTARQIRHGGSVLWISGQDLLKVPDELLALATHTLVFRLRSRRVVDHLRARVAGLGTVRFRRISALLAGQALLVATECTDPAGRGRAQLVYFRPPACAHGGHTRAVL